MVLGSFLREFGEMQENKSALGEAKKKPLIMLLVLGMIRCGMLTDNRILFNDIEARLPELSSPTSTGAHRHSGSCTSRAIPHGEQEDVR